MARRLGYLTAGSRPGDLAPEFWKARASYSYVEVTVPQPRAIVDAIMNECPSTTIFGYSDVCYPPPRESAGGAWRESWCPAASDPGWVRDATTREIVLRFGGRGLWLPKPTPGLGDPIRAVADAHARFGADRNVGFRFDNLGPSLGWNFTDRFGVAHPRLWWHGKEYAPADLAALWRDTLGPRCLMALSAALRERGVPFVASSSAKWPSPRDTAIDGWLVERGIAPTTWGGQPCNRPDGWPLACLYPDTFDSVRAMFANPALQPSVVLVEHHDLGGRPLA